jgi:catechol 2,3-dioxygenase-like lactoylglutathione lyase family enzyme
MQWFALRLERTLGYGELVDTLLDNFSDWSALPDIDSRWNGWLRNAEMFSPRYVSLWQDVTAEHRNLLHKISTALKTGALAVDNEVLSSIGALDRSTNGAGTVCAVAAAYLASRYAASPRNAVAAAATAKGADTDTLASIVGSILGCLAGDDWLDYSALALQDRRCLIDTAAQLSAGKVAAKDWPRVSERELKALKHLIETVPTGTPVDLPDGRRGVVEEPRKISGSAFMRRVSLDDGQTLVVTGRKSAGGQFTAKKTTQTVHSRVRIDVLNIAQSAAFYSDIFGLPVIRRTDKLVVFDSFALRAVSERSLYPGKDGLTIVIEVADLDAVRLRLDRVRVAPERDQHDPGARKSYKVRDPDGYLVEIIESREDTTLRSTK